LRKQLTEILNSQQQQNGSTGGEENITDLRIESPTMHKLDKAELQISEQKYSDLQQNVKSYVRRNSLLKEAKKL
jgi:hypothetical protein